MKEYCTISPCVVSNTIIIDKSKFVSYAKGVNDVQEAVDFISDIGKVHYDATHNCFAYVVGDRVKFSDNGEPQGTAGLPILECIKNNDLDNVAVVVARYFGGIKLGAPGLVRAYNGSCAGVLAIANRLRYRQCAVIDITTDYNLLSVVKRRIEGKAELKDIVFDANVIVECLILQEMQDTITQIVTEATNGKATIAVKKRLLCPYGD